MDLKKCTILIIGGTSGIGLELVRQLQLQGAKLIVTGRKEDGLRQVKKMFSEVYTFQSDVSKTEDIEELFFKVTKQFPSLNMIINNAGVMRLLDVQDYWLRMEDITKEIDSNLKGTIHMVHKFLSHLLSKESSAIVNVSSAISYIPYSLAPVYSASKAGVHAYTQALRLQLENSSVKVFEVVPPGVNTNLQNNWLIQPDQSQMMDVDKMVSEVLIGLNKGKLETRPGLSGVIKLASRIAPNFLLKFGHREFEKFQALHKIN